MKKVINKSAHLLIIALAHLLINTSIFAQAPQKMSYQAVIRNTSGALVTSASVGMKISILQGTATGTVAYSETQIASTNANGLVSLEIGSGTIIIGTFSGINWGNGPYFIKTQTDPLGGTNYTIASSSQLMSVPYALFSANGTPGPAGPQGPSGLTGPAGTNGTNGAVGATGPIGLTGPAGAQGIQGLTGATGAQGIQGLPGTNGATGAAGPSGASGTNGTNGQSAYQSAVTNGFVGTEAQWLTSLQGAQGIQGVAGATGAQGIAGTNGTNGAVGSTGPAGAQGIQGLIGPAGATGPQGIIGLTGLIGPQGIAGTNGNDGAIGEQGPIGPSGASGPAGEQGIQGVAGANGTNGINGANGRSAYETALSNGYIGTELQWLASLTGATGAQGIAGTNGTNGANGAIGSTGLTGATGPQGIAGTNGNDGAIGAQGIIGLTGPAGTNGTNGAVGPQGPTGLTGETGPIGLTGPQGTIGLTGPAGANGTTIGQMNYWNGTAWVSITPGTDGQVLSLAQGIPSWSVAPSLNAGLTTNVNTNSINYDYNSYIFSLNGILLPGPTNTDHGFVWSTNPNPTIQNSFLSLGVGTIGSNFTGQVNISQYITPNTTYYFRAYAANNYGVGYGNVLSFTTGPYLIGQNFQGGQIIRLDNTGLNGYIISSELGNSTWGCQGQNIGGTTANIGAGLQNSTLIAANCAEINIAAKKCLDYSIGVYNDWYLPSSNEFSLISTQNFQLFGIAEGAYYHTSTQVDSQHNSGIVFYSNAVAVNQVYKSQYWINGLGWQISTLNVRAFKNF